MTVLLQVKVRQGKVTRNVGKPRLMTVQASPKTKTVDLKRREGGSWEEK